MLSLADKIVALLASLTNDQIEALPTAERRRLELQCLAVAIRCAPVGTTLERKGPAANALEPVGILVELAAHRRES
jgi:hypothetical protein